MKQSSSYKKLSLDISQALPVESVYLIKHEQGNNFLIDMINTDS